MGQDWKIVNLDKRETWGSEGKLGEIFFYGAAPQSLESCLWPRTVESNTDAVIPRFKPDERYEGRAGLYFPKTAPRPLSATALINLPAEMVHEIFSHLSDLCDLLCLSVTCQVLWEIGREHIYRHIAAVVASYSWVGDRIICVGDYLGNGDIPGSILTPSERAEFFHYEPSPDDYSEDEGNQQASADPDRPLYGYPFQKTEPTFDQHRMLSQCGIYERVDWERRSPNELDIITELFHKREFAPQRPRVFRILRNLSRLQYVRELVLLGLSNKYPKVGFGEVLLTRICLSSSDSTAMAYEGLHRGVWAGDRFDIVPAEWLEALGEDPSWTDVSEEIAEEMESILQVDYL
ncbi:hypothetical protein DFH06DRAFT_1083361 [Mycena polygramma]|nr:hypothetical protein DFH06DRAFT_1051342 [Mycena polygramma]KAJ7670596.1 hypothetical protein DFH06DRAFT_1083361 [Mycena polygramma]